MSRHIALAVLILAAGLSACGKQGALERPAPLFGTSARAQYEAEQAQRARDDAQRAEQRGGQPQQGAAGEDNAPRTTREVLDPNQRLNPASTSPIPGAPNPFGSPVSPTGR